MPGDPVASRIGNNDRVRVQRAGTTRLGTKAHFRFRSSSLESLSECHRTGRVGMICHDEHSRGRGVWRSLAEGRK